jgi:hypothetical protein
VAAKSIFETSERAGLNQQNKQIQEIHSPGGPSPEDPSGATPENAKRFEDDESWRAKFLLKIQVRIVLHDFSKNIFFNVCVVSVPFFFNTGGDEK